MEPGTELHYFAHYFVLIIGFTFAYGGLKGFKDYINKVALSKGALDVSYKERIKKLSEKLILLKGAAVTEVIQQKINKADVLLKDLKENEDLAERIYDGRSFQSMFFLTGVIYLSLLILGGFHQPQLTNPFFLFMAIITMGSYFYFYQVMEILDKEARGDFHWKNTKWRNSFHVIRVYSMSFVVILILCIIAVPFMDIPGCFNSHIQFIGYDFPQLKLIQDLIMLGTISLPIWPYMAYFYRDEFLAYYQVRFDAKTKELEELCTDGELFTSQQEIIEKKEKAEIH